MFKRICTIILVPVLLMLACQAAASQPAAATAQPAAVEPAAVANQPASPSLSAPQAGVTVPPALPSASPDAVQVYLPLVLEQTPVAPAGGEIIVDHTSRDITQIPAQWIEAAKQNVVWAYGSTSHGTQLTSGAEYLSTYVNPPTYNFLLNWGTPPAPGDPLFLRMGYSGFSWDPSGYLDWARGLLNDSPDANAFMWSWCGEMSWLDVSVVQQYLDMMAQLESEYPDVRFVYMTGHTDQWADQEILNRNNNMVRDYVRANDKALYDFADIESWLPDGTPYAGTPSDDCPWCQSWCDAHPGDCPSPVIEDCAHSHSFNCYLKGQAFWWLSARLAGWNGQQK